MVATQPKFDVIFKELAVTAIQRMQRGTVIMILNDDTNALIDKAVYTGLGDVNKADFTTANLPCRFFFIPDINKKIPHRFRCEIL